MNDPLAVVVAILVILVSSVQICAGCFRKTSRYARDLSLPVSKEVL